MTWHWPGDKPLSKPMMVRLLTHICVTRPQWVNLLVIHTCSLCRFIIDAGSALLSVSMMTSSNGNIFYITGSLCREFTSHRWHKGQWRGALIFSLICAPINGWVNSCEAGELRHHRVHYDVYVTGWGWWVETPSHSLWRQCNRVRLVSWDTIAFIMTSM